MQGLRHETEEEEETEGGETAAAVERVEERNERENEEDEEKTDMLGYTGTVLCTFVASPRAETGYKQLQDTSSRLDS